ncbi:nitrite/sulfite reductase [uncultured Planktomarina sp.]|jgi:sulfite reductase (NADPH) hemoprotein beta-component|uniref:nitrite/sulfite reductase n=1 Tax=uncultured Planktomarina sp. TaxID=1538529 RepID=UPI003260FE43
MYEYSSFDHEFIAERVTQFRAQVARRLDGSLTEDEFKPLRLMNGLYLQLHAYMLRVAIPYGTLNSRQMRQLAMIAERWDKGYGHFTTRQNIQFNWPKLEDVPSILQALADVEMHAIQTSGNTVRNVTADHFAGAAADELADPRPIAELIRQWSTDHPEFQFLPRKFKIAVTGSPNDRAVTRAHDIGLRMIVQDGLRGFEVIVGGGLGRTPMIGKTLSPFVPLDDLLPYLEAVVSTYNLLGRRDNKYKARIKMTTHEHGIEEIKQRVEAQFAKIKPRFAGADLQLLKDIEQHFAPPKFKPLIAQVEADSAPAQTPVFRAWLDTNITAHKAPGYAIVSVSLKKPGATPGDASAAQMRALAKIARNFGHDELRISHEQNVILPHVHRADLPQVFQALRQADLAAANIGLVSDIIACPGMDYCALATARSIPVAQQIATRFQALKLEHDIGPLKLKISGCINACGHHHVGHIGILGLEKAGVESYQITLGGDATTEAEIGTRAGPGFGADEILPAIERLLLGYLKLRLDRHESFLEAYRRLGLVPFKALLYPQTRKAA